MKRVGLFLGVHPHAGGMFQYAQSLLDALQSLPRQDYEVVVAYVGQDWRQVMSGYPFQSSQVVGGKWGLLLANAFLAARVPAGFVRSSSSLLNPISRHLRSLACDLWIFPAQDAVGYQLGVPALVTIHDLMHRYEPHFPEVVKGGRYWVREHRFRNLAWQSKGVLVDSEMGRQHVVESYGVSRERVFPLPYVASQPDDLHVVTNEFDLKYRLPGQFLFYPAQFWAHKNHAALIRAAASLKAECPDLHLVFTGALRHEYENLVALVEKLGMMDSVTFCGYVPDADLPSFYRRARAMVMPTFFGPTNIPPLEAMSYACPMAVSGVYGMPEQLGDAALYFDPRSEESMARSMKQLWNDDEICQRLKRNGERRLATWNKWTFAERLCQILKQVTGSWGET
jgi:glycosyltransferase involved in cell wall biosynthesis